MPPRKRTSRKTVNTPERLTGSDLLKQVKQLKSLTKTEKAKACGYVVKGNNGQERAKLSDFVAAILDAQGISLDSKRSPKRGRGLSYRTAVQANGNIVIGAGYIREMGLNPGDTFDIRLGRKHIKLHLENADDFDTADDFEDEES